MNEIKRNNRLHPSLKFNLIGYNPTVALDRSRRGWLGLPNPAEYFDTRVDSSCAIMQRKKVEMSREEAPLHEAYIGRPE